MESTVHRQTDAVEQPDLGPRRIPQRAPKILVALAVLGSAVFLLPLLAMAIRAPWSSALETIKLPEVRTAIRLSLVCSLAATALSLVFGLPLAWIQARITFPGRSLLRAVTTLPVVLPPVVGGMALLLALGRNGIAGRWLFEWFGIRVPFTTVGTIIAETFVSMPFLILSMEGAFAGADRRIEEAAATLGASKWKVLTQITLPNLRPALVAAAVLCWARALGEFGATITFAGNFPGRTQTIPLAVYQALETNPDQATLLGLVMVAISLSILIALRHRLTVR